MCVTGSVVMVVMEKNIIQAVFVQQYRMIFKRIVLNLK